MQTATEIVCQRATEDLSLDMTSLQRAALKEVHAHARFVALRSVRPWLRLPWRRVEREGRKAIRDWQTARVDFERMKQGKEILGADMAIGGMVAKSMLMTGPMAPYA